LLAGVVLRLILAGGTNPLPVQVLSTERASVISIDNSIRVEHGDYFENEVVPEVLGALLVTHQISKYTMHDEGGITFSWMHPRSNYDRSSNCYFFGSGAKISYYHHLAVIACQGFTKYSLPDPVFRFRSADFLKELTDIGISVGIAMRKENIIIVILKLELEAERVVKATAFPLHAILVIANLVSVPHPAKLFSFSRGLGVNQGLLALVVRRVRLNQVDYVELVVVAPLHVGHFEVVPLGIDCCPVVVLQDQVVFELSHLYCSPQIS